MATAKTILLIDDDADFRDGIKTVLETCDHNVLTASNGADGIELARESGPDLIILDMMMTTETEGLDTSRKLQDIPETANIPVILLTGMRKAMDLPFGLEPDGEWLPVKAVLEKPISPKTLLDAVDQTLA